MYQVKRTSDIAMLYYVLFIIFILFSIMLMYGSAKNIRWMVFPWILITCLNIVFYIFILIFTSRERSPNVNIFWIL